MTDAADTLHPSAQRVADHAAARGIEIAVVEYPDEGARTAEDAASAVGCTLDQIVKSMIFTAERGGGDGREPELVLALTAGGNRVDGAKLADLAGVERCGRADADRVRATTGYAIGGVPPFGHSTNLRTWIDPRLLTFDEVWAAAGTPRHVFAITPERLVDLTGATVAPFTG